MLIIHSINILVTVRQRCVRHKRTYNDHVDKQHVARGVRQVTVVAQRLCSLGSILKVSILESPPYGLSLMLPIYSFVI